MRRNNNITKNGSGRRVLRVRWRDSSWLPPVLVRTGRTLPPCLGHRMHPTRKARVLVRLTGVSPKPARFEKPVRPVRLRQISRSRALAVARAFFNARHVTVREIRPRT